MAERKYENKREEVPGRLHETVSRQNYTLLCRPCLKKDKKMVASVFCKTCNEFQCAECSSLHSVFSFMENHKLVKASEAGSSIRQCDMKGLDKCSKHWKLFEFFCEDESLLCCSSCAIVYHRKCQSVVEIQSIDKETNLESSNTRDKLLNIKANAEMIVKETQEAEKQIVRDVNEITLKIKRMRYKAIKMFDDLEISVNERAALLRKETGQKLTEKQMFCEQLITEVTHYLDTLNEVYQNGTPSQQFIAEQKLKTQIDELRTKIEETCQDLETVSVSFDFDETLMLPPLPIEEYTPGQLTLKYSEMDTVKSVADKDSILNLEKITSIDLKHINDETEEPLYTGLDFLSDCRLVTVDNRNEKCLVFNEKLEKVGSYQLSFMPQSVVAVSEEEVAITSADDYKIEFLRVSTSYEITFSRTSQVSTEYDSLTMKDDENFVAGTINDTRPVRVVSLSGKEKDFNMNFPNKKYPIGTSDCTYLRNSDRVVFTDRDDDTVSIYIT